MHVQELFGSKIDEGVAGVGNLRRWKKATLSRVDTENIWIEYYNKAGSKLGKYCPGLTPKIGRTIVRRGVVIIVIIEGFYEWGIIANCSLMCGGAYD